MHYPWSLWFRGERIKLLLIRRALLSSNFPYSQTSIFSFASTSSYFISHFPIIQHMARVSEAEQAIEALNGVELAGSNLVVKFSKGKGAPPQAPGSSRPNVSPYEPVGKGHGTGGPPRRVLPPFETYEPSGCRDVPSAGLLSEYFYTDANGMTRDPTIRPPPEYYYRYKLLRR